MQDDYPARAVDLLRCNTYMYQLGDTDADGCRAHHGIFAATPARRLVTP